MSRLVLRHWLNRMARSPRSGRRKTDPLDRRRTRLRLESFEDRCVPSTVTNLSDHDPGSLRQAILDTPSGGMVDFQPGLSGTITLATRELAISKNLTIAGPGAGIMTVSGNNESRVFDIAATYSVHISGLTIANGMVVDDSGGGIDNAGALTLTDSTLSGNSSDGSGGGIYNSGTLTVTSSTLAHNSAFSGGGIENDSTLVVTDSILSANSVVSSGGGINNNTGTVTITGSTLSDNSTPPSGSFGGGIFNYNGTLTVTNCTISGSSSAAGGGIDNYQYGVARITSSTFSGNYAGDAGGGIWNEGSLTLTDSTLSNNTSAYWGAGIYNLYGTLTLTASTLTDNSAINEAGGGIYNYRGTLTVTDSTISGNSAYAGGGVSSNVSPYEMATITNSTITGNSAQWGGGIDTGTIFGAELSLRNTIVAGNHALSSSDVSGLFNSQGHNLIGDGTGGSGYDSTDLVGTSSTPIEPKLGPLQDNGGPTQTMAPLPSSPAIDAGEPTDAPPTDQRGLARVIDGNTDIGAVELRVFHVTSAADAGPGSLRQAILDANATPGTNGIAFALGAGGVQTIAPTSPLPTVTNPVEIDGATQSGYAGTPLVRLAGDNAGPGANGLTLDGRNSTITGLVIGGFDGRGVFINGSGNRVVGNSIGTDATGTAAHANGWGVWIYYIGSDNSIGGPRPGDGNVISGNLHGGIGVDGGSGNTFQGNFIGTDASGTQALPNGYGVELFSGSGNTVGGGTVPGAGNVISGNLYDGIGIYSDGNVIQGNFIGTDLTGTHPLGNGGDGVAIQSFLHGYDNTIGGTVPGAANTIAYNSGYGVRITTGTGNAVQENAIFANAAGGIGLFHGANQRQHAPVLTSAVSASGVVTISGTMAGSPGQTLTLEFFDNPTRTRQGETFLGSLTMMLGPDGQGGFAFQVNSGVNMGDFVTATATDAAGNTSRFSKPVQVTGTDTADGSPNATSAIPDPATVTPATGNATESAAAPAPSLPGDGDSSLSVPPAVASPAGHASMARDAADAVFAGWDTATDGLALNWT
jgi:hypothetical protein